MNKFSLCFVLFYAAVFGWISASEYNCVPNESFKDDCNTCRCMPDGKSAACTEMLCPPPPLPTTTTEASTTSVSEFKCTPNEKYKDECNTCICSADGKLAACTAMACPPPFPPSTEASSTESSTTEETTESNNHVCTPNDIRMEDCNRCRCAANGIGWFCTKRACPPKEVEKRAIFKRAVQSSHPQCKPGDSWNDGCNSCLCSDNGIALCTLMFCFGKPLMRDRQVQKRSLPENQCTPGTTWKEDCNSCFCSDTGFAACTLRGCLKKNFHTPSFVAQNLRQVTKQEYRDPDFSCTPNVSFKLDCNVCSCGEDGKTTSWCTKKQCIVILNPN